MKIEKDILNVPSEGTYAWADEVGYGILMFPAGSEVADNWLLEKGLIEEDEEPEAKPAPAAKKATAPPANKSVKGPANDK